MDAIIIHPQMYLAYLGYFFHINLNFSYPDTGHRITSGDRNRPRQINKRILQYFPYVLNLMQEM